MSNTIRRFQIARKAGGMRNAYQVGGIRFHAIELGKEEPLCGSRPAIDWASRPGAEVNCPKCSRLMVAISDFEIVDGAPEVVSF